jgi:ribokinase
MGEERSRKPKICVVGASNTDLLTKVPRLPRMGETLIGSHFHIGFGGKAANQAVMAAKLGGEVCIVTKLGKDIFGEATYENFLEQGIDTENVFWSDEASGVAPIFVDDEGNNFIVIIPGANWRLSPDDVRKASEAIKRADVVVCQLEIPLETTLEALKIAKEGGALTIFNPAPFCSLPEEIFQLSDVLAPNRVEAGGISGMGVNGVEGARRAIQKMLDLGAKAAVVTLGEGGAVVGSGKSIIQVPAIPVNCVDSTGAGDAFIGTLAYFLGIGAPLLEAVRVANVAAALSVTKLGTQLSFPSTMEIRKSYEDLFNRWPA